MNIREIVLDVLLEIVEEEEYSHIVLRTVLEKYQYLEKRDRAFITRLVEGTLENMIHLDYIIERFSIINVADMKPIVRTLLRMSVYQLKFMDQVPESAVCNESVKLVQKRGLYNLKGFVNGVLRSIVRNLDKVQYPDQESQPLNYLSITYSMPEWILKDWLALYDFETVEIICQDMHDTKLTAVRCNLNKTTKERIIASLEAEDIVVKESPYLDYALEIGGYNYIKAINAFKDGWIQVQDVSSMLVAEIAAPKWGDYCIDVCAAPGGKSLHLADKLGGSGHVEARDISGDKVKLMQENIMHIDCGNIDAFVSDATIFDKDSVEMADVLIADLPCSGLGVMGKKNDIRYKMTAAKQAEIVKLQKKILDTVYPYVKRGGTLIFSTCTIGAEENQKNVKWFLENYPFCLESLDPYICDELKSKTTSTGYLQLLPGVHQADGFFIARFKRED